jgi:type III secretion system low calcium response chaperone LcrH/SycD
MAETQNTLTDAQWEAKFDELRAHIEGGGTLAAWAEIDPTVMEGVYALGRYFYDQSDYDNASKLFGWLVSFDPFERRYSFALGATRQMQERYADAIDYLGASLALDITDPVPSFHMAECLLKMGRGKEAREMLEITVNYATGDTHASLKQSAEALLALLPPVAQTATS